MRSRLILIPALTIVAALSCSKSDVLESSAAELQKMEPVDRISTYLVGFHPMKDDPHQALEAHHFCSRLSAELTQCVLFDGREADSRMNGIEYIIPEKVFARLPLEERQYWHPHNHEIMSGQLVMPGVAAREEHEAVETLVNSYGKTWHLWRTGGHGMDRDALPLGAPTLAWSFNAEGEAPPEMIADRDRRLGVDAEEKQREREDLRPLLHCQEGVNALAASFPDRQTLPGVCDAEEPTPL